METHPGTARFEFQLGRALMAQGGGHYHGPVDGEITSATHTAIQRYAAAESGEFPSEDTTRRAPDSTVPDVALGVSQKVGLHDCDSLAARASDTERVATAVSFSTLKAQVAAAIANCRLATGEHPGVSRFEYQLGRAVDSGRADAMWNLAINLDNGMGGKADPAEAARYLLAAFRTHHERAVEAIENSLTSWERSTRQEVQRNLRDYGLYGGAIDGEIDNATLKAAQAYRDAG